MSMAECGRAGRARNLNVGRCAWYRGSLGSGRLDQTDVAALRCRGGGRGSDGATSYRSRTVVSELGSGQEELVVKVPR